MGSEEEKREEKKVEEKTVENGTSKRQRSQSLEEHKITKKQMSPSPEKDSNVSPNQSQNLASSAPPSSSSRLSALPEELQIMIADRLPSANAAALALVSKQQYRIHGQGVRRSNKLFKTSDGNRAFDHYDKLLDIEDKAENRGIGNGYRSIDLQAERLEIEAILENLDIKEATEKEDPAHILDLPMLIPSDLGYIPRRPLRSEGRSESFGRHKDNESSLDSFFCLLSRDPNTKYAACWYCETIHDPEITMSFEEPYPGVNPHKHLNMFPLTHEHSIRPCIKVFRIESFLAYTGIRFPFIAVQDLMRAYRLGNALAVEEKMRRMEQLKAPTKYDDSWTLQTDQKFQIVDDCLLTRRRYTLLLPKIGSGRHWNSLPSVRLCRHLHFNLGDDEGMATNDRIILQHVVQCKARHCQFESTTSTSCDACSKVRQCVGCEGNMEYQVDAMPMDDDQYVIVFTVWQKLGAGKDPSDEWRFARARAVDFDGASVAYRYYGEWASMYLYEDIVQDYWGKPNSSVIKDAFEGKDRAYDAFRDGRTPAQEDELRLTLGCLNLSDSHHKRLFETGTTFVLNLVADIDELMRTSIFGSGGLYCKDDDNYGDDCDNPSRRPPRASEEFPLDVGLDFFDNNWRDTDGDRLSHALLCDVHRYLFDDRDFSLKFS